MELPKLNEDILGLIFDLLGDQVTYISSILRDKYFRKNGVWLHFEDLEENYIIQFSKKICQYPLNLDFGASSKNKRVSSLEFVEDILKGISDLRLKCFPNIRSIRYNNEIYIFMENLEELENKNIIECKLIISSKEDVVEACKWIKSFRRVSINYLPLYGPFELEQSIIDRIYKCRIDYIDPSKSYPNLKYLDCQQRSCMMWYDPKNFPKLCRLKNIRLNTLDRIRQNFPHVTTIEGNVPIDMSEEEYKKLVKYRYHVYTSLTAGIETRHSRNLLEWKEKWGAANIRVRWCPTLFDDFEILAKIFENFATEINFNHECSNETVLDYLLSLTKIYGEKIIRVTGGSRISVVKVLEIHRKNGIFLDFGKMPPTPENSEYNFLRRHFFNLGKLGKI